MRYEYRAIRGRVTDRNIMAELNRLGSQGWRVSHALGAGVILLERMIESAPIPKSLEAEFHDAMVGIYHAADAHGYPPTRLLANINKLGGLAAAKRLINTRGSQAGLVELQKLGLLAISMEALILQERWNSLFTDDERLTARNRLIAHGHKLS